MGYDGFRELELCLSLASDSLGSDKTCRLGSGKIIFPEGLALLRRRKFSTIFLDGPCPHPLLEVQRDFSYHEDLV